MGSYAPLTWLPAGTVDGVMQQVVAPTLAEMRRRGAPIVGCLYVGLALTAAGPKVIEFNVRFGDPDIQPVLALLTTPLGVLLRAAADGDLAGAPEPVFADGAAVTVVMASAGYPEGSRSGDVVVGTETLADEPDVDVIHAGTARTDAGLVTAGGRVLAVRAVGSDVADARAKAYEGVSSISFPGAHWRRDIAAEPLGVVEGAASRG
jgi:phosphoribosylamine--glycine ligase